MALPFTLHTKLSISTTSVRLFHVPIISPRASHKPFEVNASTLRLRGLSLSLVSDKRLSHCCSISSSTTRVSMATKGEVKKEVFESAEDLAVSLAKYTAQLSDKFCKERGAFSVVLSGGSLINSLRKLVEPPYIDSIEWSKWHIFWADERVVPKDHEDSNYKLAYDGFLSKMEERETMTAVLEAMTTATGMGAAPTAVSALPSPSAVSGFSNNSTSELAMVVLLAHCSWKFEALAFG